MVSTATATSVLKNTKFYNFINILCALTIMNSMITLFSSSLFLIIYQDTHFKLRFLVMINHLNPLLWVSLGVL